MPNKYKYNRLNTSDTSSLLNRAGLSASDAVKLFGRHYNEIKDYLDPNSDKNPTVPEMILLLYLAEHPDQVPVMLDIANVRIIDGKQNKVRFYGNKGIL